MGLILDDDNKGVHAEARRESFVLFGNFGYVEGTNHPNTLELRWGQLAEVKRLVDKLVVEAKRRNVVTDCESEPEEQTDAD